MNLSASSENKNIEKIRITICMSKQYIKFAFYSIIFKEKRFFKFEWRWKIWG